MAPSTGGGVALLYASKELDKLPTANFDQKIGVQIIQNALKVMISNMIVYSFIFNETPVVILNMILLFTIFIQSFFLLNDYKLVWKIYFQIFSVLTRYVSEKPHSFLHQIFNPDTRTHNCIKRWSWGSRCGWKALGAGQPWSWLWCCKRSVPHIFLHEKTREIEQLMFSISC